MKLQELKQQGIKYVILNGFKERIGYVLTLSNVTWVEEIKSEDGVMYCYTC